MRFTSKTLIYSGTIALILGWIIQLFDGRSGENVVGLSLIAIGFLILITAIVSILLDYRRSLENKNTPPVTVPGSKTFRTLSAAGLLFFVLTSLVALVLLWVVIGL